MTQSKGTAPDLIGDLQRWLVRSGARGVSREVSGHLRAMLGRGEPGRDVWETATSTDPQEAPECAWCPVCRAARLLRESGPGVSSQVTAASDALAGMAQDMLSVVESALASTGRPDASATGTGPPAAGDRDRPGSSGQDDVPAGRNPAGSSVTWVETEPAGVWEQAAAGSPPGQAEDSSPGQAAGSPPGQAEDSSPGQAAGSSPGQEVADPGHEPGPAGSPGGPVHEPDDRD